MKFEYFVIDDGWIKIDAAGWTQGKAQKKSSRLLLGLNQLVVRINDVIVLVDTGLGDKWTAPELGLIDYHKPRGLIDQLSQHHISTDDIDVVVLTHLHYDHSGGGTYLTGSNLAPTFTKALYYVQKREYDIAKNPPDNLVADYRFKDDVVPLEKAGQLVLIDGDSEVAPGIKVFLTPGHSVGHQVVLFESSDGSIFFPGDLFSTREHCNLEAFTAYDFDPKELHKYRQIWLQKAIDNRWKCVYCHAVREPVGTLNNRDSSLHSYDL